MGCVRGTTNEITSTRTIRLKIERLQAEAERRKWTTAREMARALGVSGANLSRLLSEDPDERQMPGTKFIAAVLDAFPTRTFEYFFEVVHVLTAPVEVERRSA